MMEDNDITAVAVALKDSKYFLCATGMRDCGLDEIKGVLEIILESLDSGLSYSDKMSVTRSCLDHHYDHHPATIAVDFENMSSQCPGFCSECDCWLPDIEVPHCRRMSRKGRNSTEYRKWRKDCLVRDGYKCQVCGCVSRDLHVHHIEPWAKSVAKRFEVDNGVTLCSSCHKEKHKAGGCK